MSAAVVSSIIAGLVAIIVAFAGSRWDAHRQADQLRHELDRDREEFAHALELQEQRLRSEMKTEYMAEAALNRLLTVREPKRSFEQIKLRVGGFADDELRQLLVRAGALRYRGNDGQTEYWGLPSRTENAE